MEEKQKSAKNDASVSLTKSDAQTNSAPTNNKTSKNKASLRTRLKSDSIDMVELEQLNEQNLKKYRSRSRRNRSIIITLVELLILAIAGIAIILGVSRLQNNSFLYVHGDGSAVYIVDGNQLSKFRTPTDIQGNRLLQVDIDLSIKSSGSYNIKFTIDIYQDGTKLDNCIIYEYDHSLFTYGTDGYCYSISPISAGTINLCEGVLIDYVYESTLNISNFKMEVHTYLEQV